jgi:hypothetical protein
VPLVTRNTDDDLEMTRVAEQKILTRMDKLHDFLEMWQVSQNLRAAQQ